jgi:gliding motility-associated-like protein
MKFIYFSILAFSLTLFACNEELKKHCCDTSAQSFTSDSVAVFVPNAFTPNKDGINDVFTYQINKPELFTKHQLKVFKGALIAFDKQDTQTIVWDGLVAGKEAKENVLDYILLLKRKDVTTADSIIQLTGKVCLRKKTPICAGEMTNCRFSDQLNEVGFTNPTNEKLDTDCK